MLNFTNAFTFSQDVEPDGHLRNFWAPEDGFVWSTGKWCEIVFPFELSTKPRASACDLIFDFDVFKHDETLDGQNVLVYLNGLRVGSIFCKKRATYIFTIDSSWLRAEDNNLTLDTPDVACPSDFGIADTRHLGVQMFSFRIREAM